MQDTDFDFTCTNLKMGPCTPPRDGSVCNVNSVTESVETMKRKENNTYFTERVHLYDLIPDHIRNVSLANINVCL